MRRNMRLRVVIEWEDGEPVMLDGAPLAISEDEFVAACQAYAKKVAKMPFSKDSIVSAVEENYEHPKQKVFSTSTTKQVNVEEAVKTAVSDGYDELLESEEGKRAIETTAYDCVSYAVRESIRDLKKKTVKVVS